MSGQPPTRTVLRFWAVEPGHVDQEWTGWWDGRHFVALYGDGMWSPEYVTRWEPLLTEERSTRPEWEDCTDSTHNHGRLYGDTQPYSHIGAWHPVRRYVTQWERADA